MSRTIPLTTKFDKFAWLKDVCRNDVAKEALCCATVLFNYANQDGSNCYPSYLTLENEAKLSDKGVKKGLEELVFAGLLTIDKRGKGNQYTLLMARGWEGRIASGHKFQRTKKAPRGGRQGQGGGSVQGSRECRAGESSTPCQDDWERRVGDGLTYQDHIRTKSINISGANIPTASQRDSDFGKHDDSVRPSDSEICDESSEPYKAYTAPCSVTAGITWYVPGMHAIESETAVRPYASQDELAESYWDKNGNEVFVEKDDTQVIVRDKAKENA